MNNMENNAELSVQIDPSDSEAVAKYAVTVIDSKKARNIKLLHVEDRTSIADYFVICSVTSSTQMKAVVDEVEYKLGLCGIKPNHIEGRDSGWMVIDFISVVVHVFTTEAREFYKLDKLYADNADTDITGIVDED